MGGAKSEDLENTVNYKELGSNRAKTQAQKEASRVSALILTISITTARASYYRPAPLGVDLG